MMKRELFFPGLTVRWIIHTCAFVVFCSSAFPAEPTDQEIDHLAKVIDTGDVGAMRKEVEGLLGKYPDSETLKKVRARLEKARQEGVGEVDAFAGQRAGERKVLSVAGAEVALRWCPPGSFTMGSTESETERSSNESRVPVRLTKGFWMAETECTQAQWQAVMGANPSYKPGAQLPVERVSWEVVVEFIAKLNAAGGRPVSWKWSLPTEAQWEYACRARTQTAFFYGNSLSSLQANFSGNYSDRGASRGAVPVRTTAVASYAANAWGLHDMHGNVAEWCADWYAKDVEGGVDPGGPLTGVYRVFRGGSWFHYDIFCRSSHRDARRSSVALEYVGFRLALIPSR